MRLHRLALVALVVVGCSLPTTAHALAPSSHRVVRDLVQAYGDSLLREADDTISAQTFTGEKVTVAGELGRAPCDFLAKATTLISKKNIKLLVIESAGNSVTTCMRIPGGCGKCFYVPGSQAWKDKLRADMDAIFDLTNDEPGMKELIVSPPPFTDPDRDSFYNTVFPLLQTDAASYTGITVTDAPRNATSNNGAYVTQLPCQTGETAADGCSGGLITVRAPDGVHFCPTGFAANFRSGCAGYDSGGVRYGNAIADAIRTQ